MLLFVYGSLMKDLWNHGLLETSIYLGEFQTTDKYVLSIDGKIPYLSSKQKLYHVNGELYEVSPEYLKNIDKLEYEGDWYHRKEISIVARNSERDNPIIAQAYFNDDEGIVFSSGNYRNFLDDCNHFLHNM